MFLLASAALPDEVPFERLDLKAYYFDNASYFWGLYMAFLLLTILIQLVPVGFIIVAGGVVRTGLVLIGISGNLVSVAIVASLCYFRNRTYHSIVVPIMLLYLTIHWSRLKLG
jgi:hypothetical protein